LITVGAFEAKTHLSTLLERVALGEKIVIIRHGKPSARLIPVTVTDRSRIEHAIPKLKALHLARVSLLLRDLEAPRYWRDIAAWITNHRQRLPSDADRRAAAHFWQGGNL